MKKILLSVLTLALSVNLFAINYSGKVTVAIFDGSHIHNATIAESSDVPEGQLLNGYYTPVQDLNSLSVAAYVPFNNVAYESIVLHSLTNTPLVIKASTVSNYSLYFTNLEDPISLYDTKVGQFVDMTTNPYNFTIEDSERDANNIVANRFMINYVPAPVAVASVTTNEDGWASFAYTADVAPADPSLAVYKGALNNSDPENPAIVLTAVTTGIPAGEGVFVLGEPLTTYYFSATTATAFSGNDLVGCTVATDPAGISDAIYTLRNVGGVTGLYNYVGTAAIPAGKAYLPVAVSGSNPAPARVRMVINGAQGIEEVQGDKEPCTKFVKNGQVFIRRGNEVYNLQGQIVK